MRFSPLLVFPFERLKQIPIGVEEVDEPHMVALGYSPANLDTLLLHRLHKLVKVLHLKSWHKTVASCHASLLRVQQSKIGFRGTHLELNKVLPLLLKVQR